MTNTLQASRDDLHREWNRLLSLFNEITDPDAITQICYQLNAVKQTLMASHAPSNHRTILTASAPPLRRRRRQGLRS